MGMKLKSGADLCGFQLTNFCVQGEASAPSDAALGRKYFHTNATDDVATGISLLNRERIYLGEGAWRATAYLDDIAAIQTKLDMILGDVDLDGVIENMNEVIKFLEDNKDTENLMTLLNGKLNKAGGTINGNLAVQGYIGLGSYLNANDHYFFVRDSAEADWVVTNQGWTKEYTLIHSGNIGSYNAGGIVSLGYPTTDTFADYITKYAKGASVVINDSGADVGNITKYESVLNVGTGAGRFGRFIFSVGTNPTLCFQTGNDSGNGWGNKKTIAFTDSDITGNAAGLKHSNGTVAISLRTNGDLVLGGTRFLVGENQKSLLEYSDINIAFGYSYRSLAPMNIYGTSVNLRYGANGTHGLALIESGNVLIGATTDDNSGAKLQVNGLISCYSSGNGARHIFVGNANGAISLYAATSGNRGLFDASNSTWMVYTDGTDIIMPRDVHIKGNLIVDGEVSAGGAGAEEGTSGSGSAEGVSEIFTPTSTSMAFDHNLGEDVIVQVYEKSGNVWNLVIVDVEITSATRVTLRFGKTETTQHKVVIMGV